MNAKLPSISDDIRTSAKKIALNLKPREDLSDDDVMARSREIGEKWGASTQIAPAPALAGPPPAPLTSVRFDAPDYLDRELSVRAAEQGVTKTYLILQALGNAGFRLDEVDLGLIREYLNRVACDRPVSGFPLLEEFVTPFG